MTGEPQRETFEVTPHATRMTALSHFPRAEPLGQASSRGWIDTKKRICDLKKGGIAALGRMSKTQDLFELTWIATPRLIRRLGGES
jgi:hypothetical protein